ncbi:MAG: TlpA family protein disulfide reductase [Deltaproteobacteria bacterium]|nr:TlpA family protein disulfide reductase [Deltaproteobacteria bacterium]
MALTRKKIIIPLLFIAGLVLAYMVQEGGRHGERRQISKGPASAEIQAPDFTVRDLEGKEVSLSDFRGSLVFLNFWATWCPPCREEMPSIERLYKLMQGKPFHILAVSVDNDAGVVERFRKSRGYTFPMFIDDQQKAARLYQTTGVPETFIISPEGKILNKIIGPEEWSTGKPLAYLQELLPKL